MKILVDSDALFALFVELDPHHSKAKALLSELNKKNVEIFVSNLVIQETATVLSHKINHSVSLEFLDKLPSLSLIQIAIDQALEQTAWQIFKKQTKKGSSFVDCSNLAIIEKYKLDSILSFDTFYPKSLRPPLTH